MKLVLLSLLYFAEGLPFGFQSVALPVYLRESGRSLVAIGFLGALSLPWMLKPLWAPLVDGWGATRRTWILPMLGGVAASCAAAGLVDPAARGGLAALLALVFLMNLFAATLDIAVDGLAVDLLARHELGGGNAAQVVGYKVGMLTGGGLFVYASAQLPWRVLLLAMGAVVLAVLVAATVIPATRTRSAPPQKLGSVLADLFHALRAPGTGELLLFLLTYKVGESMAGAMWKPFLVDAGFDKPFIGTATGFGMAASILGSLAGGWLASRTSLARALLIPAAARLLPMAAQVLVTAWPTAAGVVAVMCAENLAGGALTTVVFAAMMARVEKRIGASHYTALAAVEVAGKFPGAWASGAVAQAFGYPALYAVATVATAGVLPLIARLRSHAVHDLD